jgi:serine/threonine protein kinase
MAPEVLEGKARRIDSEMDVWAMGVILFAMVTLVNKS